MTEFDRFVASWLEDDGPQDVRAEARRGRIVGARNPGSTAGSKGPSSGVGPAASPSVGRPLPLRRLTILIAILLIAAAAAVIVGALIRLPSPVEPAGRVDHSPIPSTATSTLPTPDGQNPSGSPMERRTGVLARMSWFARRPPHASLDGDGDVDVRRPGRQDRVLDPGCCSAGHRREADRRSSSRSGGVGGPPMREPAGPRFVIVDPKGPFVIAASPGRAEPTFLRRPRPGHPLAPGRKVDHVHRCHVQWGSGPGPGFGTARPGRRREPTPLRRPPPVPSRTYSPDGTERSWGTTATNGAFVVAAADGSAPGHLYGWPASPGSPAGTGMLWSPDGLGSRHPRRRSRPRSST